jgi:hypothetical protein
LRSNGQLSAGKTNKNQNNEIPVGAGLPAMAVYQSTTMLKLMASSRAGSLLQGSALRFTGEPHLAFCRSEPARDGGGSVNDDVEADGLIASRLAHRGLCGA